MSALCSGGNESRCARRVSGSPHVGSWIAQRFREVGRKSFATVQARHLYRTASLASFLAMPGLNGASPMAQGHSPYGVDLAPAHPRPPTEAKV